ncbi:MAG: DinB family protein [Cytophagales bacterium]|nr:MAG: DinB family protein [Cytophagales bacterium]TAF59480.1 MAG: DinB family protein [Cytophagales bacterium]
MSIISATASIFDQITEQISRLSSAQYSQSLPILSGSSIGQHVRHIVEFYECLFSQQGTNCVCYDRRQRDLRLETEIPFVKSKLNTYRALLDTYQINNPLSLVVYFTPDADEVPTEINSNWGRELAYNIEHAIHHLAIIKIGIKEAFHSVSIIENLGVAPATVKHHHIK